MLCDHHLCLTGVIRDSSMDLYGTVNHKFHSRVRIWSRLRASSLSMSVRLINSCRHDMIMFKLTRPHGSSSNAGRSSTLGLFGDEYRHTVIHHAGDGTDVARHVGVGNGLVTGDACDLLVDMFLLCGWVDHVINFR